MLYEELLKRKKELELIIEMTEGRTRIRDGKLRCNINKGAYQYYLKTSKGNESGEYIPADKIQIAKDIVQQEYNQKMLEMARNEMKLIDNYLQKNDPNKFVDLYEKMSPARKVLVKPIIISDKEYAKRWQAKKYVGNTKWEMKTRYTTRRGDVVRSKSEMIIADTLYSLGIPYHYEYPVTLENGITYYSDFTALNVRERKEYRIEHLGMLDNSEYRMNTLRKIETYENNYYFPGKNLLITFDIEGKELDSHLVEIIAREFLL